MLSRVCVYDMPPDKEFTVDLLPGDPRITVAIGGSGHAGTFAAFLGKVVADLATSGATAHPVSIFSVERSSLVDPGIPAHEPAQRDPLASPSALQPDTGGMCRGDLLA
ncbi:MAG: hypothetical protein M3116_02695 [Actinomycetota bacterium]|nr:hypothetical protein [Actinomycetota bacterium]